jgi:hypothetical protein
MVRSFAPYRAGAHLTLCHWRPLDDALPAMNKSVRLRKLGRKQENDHLKHSSDYLMALSRKAVVPYG